MTEENNQLKIRWRKSSEREDSEKAAERLAESLETGDLSKENIENLVRAGVRTGELERRREGQTYFLIDPESWFKNRVLSNTVSLSRGDYLTALASSLEIVVLGEPSRIDFGPRRREFGQQWTDFLRGYLGEVALKKFFQERLGTEVKLEQRETGGGIQKYLPTDVTEVKESGNWKGVRKTLSIKTTKLGNMWLAIRGGRLAISDAFLLVKIGIPANHLAIFLKEIGALEDLFEFAESAGVLEDFKTEKIWGKIPDFNPIPAYIPGFCWKSDFENGQLEAEGKQKHLHVKGGIGRVSELPAPPDPEGGKVIVEGFGDEPAEDCLAACGALRWKKEDWEELLDSM